MKKYITQDIYYKSKKLYIELNNVEYFDKERESYSHYNSLFMFDGSHQKKNSTLT